VVGARILSERGGDILDVHELELAVLLVLEVAHPHAGGEPFLGPVAVLPLHGTGVQHRQECLFGLDRNGRSESSESASRGAPCRYHRTVALFAPES